MIGQFATSVEEKTIQLKSPITPKVDKDDSKVKEIKRSFFKQDYQINKRMKLKLERGLIRPEIIFNRVVFPQPEGPNKA